MAVLFRNVRSGKRKAAILELTDSDKTQLKQMITNWTEHLSSNDPVDDFQKQLLETAIARIQSLHLPKLPLQGSGSQNRAVHRIVRDTNNRNTI